MKNENSDDTYPGHFQAALVQKEMLHQVDPSINIFAPESDDFDLHKVSNVITKN